ncbi:DUF6292 family protein [Lentzea sp. NPDC051208]|uniref:DUF6292 family protein n=1 Tax=Lentzea sp. NPDC051208 TaxID=3154642 RepID=UPI003447E738
MELDFDDTWTRGVRRHVRLVARALGLSPQCCCVQGERPSNAYVALDGRLPDFPGREVALLWDERHGWSLAIETHSGEDLIVVEQHGDELRPEPSSVARWARSALRGDGSAPVPNRVGA